MVTVLSTCLPIILMVAIGMICRRYHVISQEGADTLKKVTLNITLPPLMMAAFAKIDYSFKNILILILVLAVCFLGILLGKLLKKALRIESRYMPLFTTTFEIGLIGYALFSTLYPNENLGTIASFDVGLTFFCNTVYRILITRQNHGENISGKKMFAGIFSSPIIIGIIIGVFLGLSGIYRAMVNAGIAEVFDYCTDFIGKPTSAIIMLAIGYDIVLSDIPWRAVSKTILARVLVMILLRIGIGYFSRLFGLQEFDHAFNVVFILPPAYILPIFASDEKQSSYIASCMSVYTILTIAAFVGLAILAH